MSLHARPPEFRMSLPPRLAALAIFALAVPASAADWVHWRGPEGTGQSRETGLPGDFDPAQKAAGNVVWQAPFGGRSTPLVMGGRVYILQGTGTGLGEAEQVVCVEEATGKPLWTYRVNVFHTDIVSTRVGWPPLTADPATGNVFVQTTAGLFLCLDKAGKVVWQKSLTEEYGRASGYGGRLPAPIFDEATGLVIAPMVSSSWGDFARGANRFVAFDGKTGEVAWWNDTMNPSKETYCSHPVIAVIGGQRLLLSGGSDGYLHAIKARTGEKAWSYQFSSGAINGSPVVDGNLIYCGHGDENPEGAPYGRIICVDGSQVDPKTKRPKLVWDTHKRAYKANKGRPLSSRFGLASVALADGRLYAPDDTGDLYAFNAKTGEMLWKYHYATEVRGSPLVADGKLYIFDVKSKLVILTLDGDKKPDELNTFEYQFREPRGVYSETNGTPIAVNGRVYFVSAASLWCLGKAEGDASKPDARPHRPAPTEPAKVAYKQSPPETPLDPGAAPAGVRLFPADVVATPGQAVKFSLKFYDANGRDLPTPADVKAEWSVVTPAKTPTGAQPPPLAGKLDGAGAEGTVTLGPLPSQQGYVEAKVGDKAARARVRMAGRVPFKQDFEKLPAGASPGGWVNTNGKFVVEKLPDGNTVLAKTNNDPRPPLAKANAYITMPNATGYTIQADLMGTQVRGGMPDIGVINNRYTLVLDGKTDPAVNSRSWRLVSWEARPRVALQENVNWAPGTWYTAKLTVELKATVATVRGKIWEKGKPEPEKWTFEFEDPSPNREGSAGLYGYVTNASATELGANGYYDNVSVTPNDKK